MALDRLDHQNTLRATFRCENTIQMAFLEQLLRGVAEANPSLSVAKTSLKTLNVAFDAQAYPEMADQPCSQENLQAVLSAAHSTLLSYEKEHHHAEIISMTMPQHNV